MNSIKELVENPHWIHRKYSAYWNFLLDSWEGGIDYTLAYIPKGANTWLDTLGTLFKVFAGGEEIKSTSQGNLFAHPKERDKDYKTRVQQSYYYNFCRPVVDIYTNHLFKQEIIANFGSISGVIDIQKENIDRKQSSIEEFRKELADFCQVYGHIYVVVDMPNNQDPIYSLRDRMDLGIFPYLSFYAPQNVINWALDIFGRPYWVLLAEYQDKNVNPFEIDKNKDFKVQYRLWTREEWILYDAEYNEIARMKHGLGIVPIVCVYDKQSKKSRAFLGISALADIAFIARDIYNSCSELRQILRDQTFAFLALQGEASEYDELSIGTGKGLLYPPGRNAPQYVSPPAQNAEVYFNHIDRQVKKLFQLASLEGGSASFEGQTAVDQSGVSKAWDFNETNSTLAKKAGSLEDGETKIWQIFSLWEGKEFDGFISYPREFSLQSLKGDMDEAEQAARLMLGKTFNIEVKKAIAKKKFPRVDEDTLDTMVKEIEVNEGKGESGRLTDRIPSIIERFAKNANFSGK